MTRVVNLRKEPYTTYVGRGSKWGNRFVIGTHGTRDEVISMYETWIRGQPELLAALPELRGETLGCYCSPLACHGTVLIRLLDELHPPPSPKENPEVPV